MLSATALLAGSKLAGSELAGSESDKAGPLGLLTIVALGIAVYFLYRSMVRHVKKVPASFDPPADTRASGPSPAGTSASGTSASGTSPAEPASDGPTADSDTGVSGGPQG